MQAHDLTANIDSSILKPLFKTSPIRHLLSMAFDWIVIGCTIYGTILSGHPLVYFLAVLIIGARMHGLAILMHDATHFRFLKNRKLNDLVTNLLTMYPLFTTIDTYRKNHLRHHQHLNTEHDPDWVAKLGKQEFTFPKTKTEFLKTIGAYLTLYNGITDAIWFFKRFQSGTPVDGDRTEAKWPSLLFYTILILVLSWTDSWSYYLLFWVVPYLSTFFMFQYIRSVAEHFGEMAYDDMLTSSRTVRANWIERFFIAPHQVSYHLEHHLFPGVPFYHLPKLHKVLMSEDEYQQKAHITQGYVSGLLNELGAHQLATTS